MCIIICPYGYYYDETFYCIPLPCLCNHDEFCYRGTCYKYQCPEGTKQVGNICIYEYVSDCKPACKINELCYFGLCLLTNECPIGTFRDERGNCVLLPCNCPSSMVCWRGMCLYGGCPPGFGFLKDDFRNCHPLPCKCQPGYLCYYGVCFPMCPIGTVISSDKKSCIFIPFPCDDIKGYCDKPNEYCYFGNCYDLYCPKGSSLYYGRFCVMDAIDCPGNLVYFLGICLTHCPPGTELLENTKICVHQTLPTPHGCTESYGFIYYHWCVKKCPPWTVT